MNKKEIEQAQAVIDSVIKGEPLTPLEAVFPEPTSAGKLTAEEFLITQPEFYAPFAFCLSDDTPDKQIICKFAEAFHAAASAGQTRELREDLRVARQAVIGLLARAEAAESEVRELRESRAEPQEPTSAGKRLC